MLAAAVLLHAAFVHAADDPLANGVLLVAKPDLPDPNFRETVVLITQPVPGGGPLGVILNRPTGARLSEAWPDAVRAGGIRSALRRRPGFRNQVIFLVRSRRLNERPARAR